ncbi:MAG TPA: hypothetical protein VKP13_09145 [Nitrospira sp.]|nr:hypothetical protein [Nitrospira sp.]
MTALNDVMIGGTGSGRMPAKAAGILNEVWSKDGTGRSTRLQHFAFNKPIALHTRFRDR